MGQVVTLAQQSALLFCSHLQYSNSIYEEHSGLANKRGSVLHRDCSTEKPILPLRCAHCVAPALEPDLSAQSSLCSNLSIYSLCIYLWVWNLGFWNPKVAQDIQISVTGLANLLLHPRSTKYLILLSRFSAKPLENNFLIYLWVKLTKISEVFLPKRQLKIKKPLWRLQASLEDRR